MELPLPVCASAWSGDARGAPHPVRARRDRRRGNLDAVQRVARSGQQIRATPALWPGEPPRHSPIGSVVLTSAEVDHVAGLLSLRERQPFRLIALASVHAVLQANPLFDILERSCVARVTVEPRGSVHCDGRRLRCPPYRTGETAGRRSSGRALRAGSRLHHGRRDPAGLRSGLRRVAGRARRGARPG